MTDNTTVENDSSEKFPDTIEELKSRFPSLATFPDTTGANTFTPAQSAMFGTVSAIMDEAVSELADAGIITTSKRRSNRQHRPETIDFTFKIAQAITACDQFFSGIVKDADAYKTWCTGRRSDTLFFAYLALVRFYENELGKSDASRMPQQSAERE